GRADIIGAASRLIWRRRNARDQRVAGEASAKNAVKIEGPAEPPVEAPEVAEADEDHAVEPFVPDPRVAAFFAVDDTLIPGASIRLLARGLAKHKFFTGRGVAGMAWTELKCRVSGKENADDVAAGREKALSFVEGHTVTELTQLSEEVVDGSRSEEHTSELQSRFELVCRLLLEKKILIAFLLGVVIIVDEGVVL